MILLIIFGVLFVAGLLFGILGYRKVFKDRDGYYSEANEVANRGGDVVAMLGMLGLVICSIIAIVNNNSLDKEIVRVKYQERINSINNTRQALENQLQSSTLTILEVSAYNDSAREFKQELKKDQLLANNPWIGCLCSPVCKEFSINAVSYLYID